jgi:hypothetical protein
MEKPIEVMSVVRRPPLGQLVVENKGNQYEKLNDINNPQLAQMMLAAIGELVAFAGGYQALVDAGFAPDLAGIDENGPSLEEQQAAFLAQLQQKNPATASQNSSNSASFFRRRRSSTAVEEPTSLDIVGALDDLFQKHLTRMPELQDQHVRVENSPRGGTRINVNGHYYDDAGEIPNPMIRLAFKMAVREWEASAADSSPISGA